MQINEIRWSAVIIQQSGCVLELRRIINSRNMIEPSIRGN